MSTNTDTALTLRLPAALAARLAVLRKRLAARAEQAGQPVPTLADVAAAVLDLGMNHADELAIDGGASDDDPFGEA